MAKENGKGKEWFGASLAAATGHAAVFPVPLTAALKDVVAPHILKASCRRAETLAAIELATGTEAYHATMAAFFQPGGLGTEGHFSFNTLEHPLQVAFTRACGLPAGSDLSQLHTPAASLAAAAAAAAAASSASTSASPPSASTSTVAGNGTVHTHLTDAKLNGAGAGADAGAGVGALTGSGLAGPAPAPIVAPSDEQEKGTAADDLKDLMMAKLVQQPHLFQ